MLEILSGQNVPVKPGLKLCPTSRKEVFAKQKQESSEFLQENNCNKWKMLQRMDAVEQEGSFSSKMNL